ncbi:MAG: hypothetical protein WDZ69_01965 [Candidatus Pacearchaeota archaeon]
MKKTIFVSGVMFSLFVMLLLGLAVSAQEGEIIGDEDEDLGEDISNFVKKVAKGKGISEAEIKNVRRADFNDLPKGIDLGNIDDTNLALYELTDSSDRPIYVLTVSDETFRKTLSSEDYKRSFLSFGFSGEMSDSGFLKTATDVETSLEKGYVMTRGGSLTALSTNLEVTETDASGDVEIVVYINGDRINVGNILSTESEGSKKDYDVLSGGVAEFEAGDVVSVELKSNGEAVWQDVTTLVEITTKD